MKNKKSSIVMYKGNQRRLDSGKVVFVSGKGLVNPVKFANFDGNKYKQNKNN